MIGMTDRPVQKTGMIFRRAFAIATLSAAFTASASAALAQQTKRAVEKAVIVKPAPPPSAAAQQVLDWVTREGDNGTLPFMIVDKSEGRLLLYGPDGKPLAETPVLIGIGVGDDASPGVGSKKLSEIGPAERTTPAGRYLAKFGVAAGNKQVLWIDWSTSVALHPVVTGNAKERRLQRLSSATPDDNRITYGCINVPVKFYQATVRPLFRKAGGMVYVLPDSKPIEDVFPRLRVQQYIQASADKPTKLAAVDGAEAE